MRKYIRNILGFGAILIGIIFFIIPGVYWIKNPDQTQMQISIMWGWCFILGIVASFLGFFIIQDK